VKNQLALSATGEQQMTIATFGATQKNECVCEYAGIGLQLKNGRSLILTVLCVPAICEPLTSHPLVDY